MIRGKRVAVLVHRRYMGGQRESRSPQWVAVADGVLEIGVLRWPRVKSRSEQTMSKISPCRRGRPGRCAVSQAIRPTGSRLAPAFTPDSGARLDCGPGSRGPAHSGGATRGAARHWSAWPCRPAGRCLEPVVLLRRIHRCADCWFSIPLGRQRRLPRRHSRQSAGLRCVGGQPW